MNLEQKVIIGEFKNIEINNINQLFEIQNKVISQIKHYPVSSKTIDILNILKLKKGLCYDRSMLLQKVILINKLPAIPVFLYFNPSKKNYNP